MANDDTGDLDKTGSTTKQMRAVKAELEKEKMRDEWREKEFGRLEKSVYSQRERVSSLEKRVPDTFDALETERRLLKVEQAVAILKWVAGVVGTSIIGLIIAALAGGCN